MAEIIKNKSALLYNCKLNIKSAYYSFKIAEEFLDTNSYILNNLTEEEFSLLGQANAEKQLARVCGRVYRDFSCKIAKKDLIREHGMMPQEVIDILKGIKINCDLDTTYVSIPVKGCMNVCIKKQRGGITLIKGSTASEAFYSIRNAMAPFGQERYSIGISNLPNKKITDAFGIGLIGREATTGMKGGTELIVTAIINGVYYIDDASKYIDVAPFLTELR